VKVSYVHEDDFEAVVLVDADGNSLSV